MKKILIAVSVLVCTYATTPAHGQGFLDKVKKAVEKVDSELNKVAGKESTTNKPKQSQQLADVANGSSEAYNGVMIRPFSPHINISLESCIREGSKVTIVYMMTNSGADFTIAELGSSKNIINPTEETVIMDNNGRSCELRYFAVGDKDNSGFNYTLPSGVPVRCELEIYNVAQTAKSLSLVNIAGMYKTNPPGTADQLQYFSYAFKNVPIYTVEQTLQMMNPTVLATIQRPYVETIDESYTVESVQITDKYTQVDISYTNRKYNPSAHLILIPDDMPSISVKGEIYPMLMAKGITPRQGDVIIKYNESGNYSLIFEPIPAATTTFDITGEGFLGVTLKSDINIPATKGVFPSLDVNCDAYYKRPRMVAADRARYKVNNIKIPDFPTQIQNNQLSKGKLIYKCDKGSIETFLFIVVDQVTIEYMVSYNKVGNVIDCIPIGTISAYGGDRGYADIVGDKVTVYSYYPAEGDDEDGNSVDEYRVTPNLKFVKLTE